MSFLFVVQDSGLVISGFSNVGRDLVWYCDPKSWDTKDDEREGHGGSWSLQEDKLVLSPPAKKDFWRKTYYKPVLIKDDGPCLFATLPSNECFTVETSFVLDPKRQFDQAGICIRLDHQHWLKTGIEVVDGKPRLSCVVTNGYSDWSTQNWSESKLRIRVTIKGDSSFVVEASPFDGNDFSFIRIAHLDLGHGQTNDRFKNADETAFQGPSPPHGSLWAGVFGCCPEDNQGCMITFHDLKISRGTSFEHTADGNAEQVNSFFAVRQC